MLPFLWGGQTFGRHVVMYIDNEASRMTLVKAYSSTLLGNVVIQLFVKKKTNINGRCGLEEFVATLT
jgi:hypothetical protein